MVSKLSWIAFIPFTLAAIVIELARILFINDANPTLFGLTDIQLSYIAIGCVVLVLLFAILFVLIDRKTAPYYVSGKNIALGIVGLLLALLLACDGANSIFNIFESSNILILALLDCILTLLSAVVFVVIGLSHFSVTGNIKGMAVFYLIPAVWSAVKLIRIFLTFTTVSILSSEINSGEVNITALVAFVFLTLFLFNYAVLISMIKGKSPVKLNMVYGFPAVAGLLAYCVFAFSKIVIEDGTIELLPSYMDGTLQIAFCNKIEMALFAIYILIFLIELTSKMKTNDEIEVIETEEEEEVEEIEDRIIDNATKEEKKKKREYLEEEMVITGVDEELADRVPVHSYLETQDTSDFLYRATSNVEDTEKASQKYEELTKDDVSDYLTSDTTRKAEPEEEKEKKPSDTSRMDEIDQLILSISEDNKDE